ncbi:MAG: radical SAM protein [Candidatus Lindowbacteria bacterium]|nr:radical SAM protein [Candidatus Lindowbacteria bacterium]
MSRAPACQFPPRPTELPDDPVFQVLCDTSRADAVKELKPTQMEIELTTKCAASCRFCCAASTSARTEAMTLEESAKVVQEAAALGVRAITWMGGDPQTYPHIRELFELATNLGISMQMPTSGLFSKQHIALFNDFQDNLFLGVHLDTIDPDTYAKLHNNPRTRKARMDCFKRLLDSGFPSFKTFGLITMTAPVLERIEETLDWFYDEMKTTFVCLMVFKGEGFGKETAYLEPSLSGVKRAITYRAGKMGGHWLRLGASEASIYYCRTTFCVDVKGHAHPCLAIRDYCKTESVFEHGLEPIVEKYRDKLFFNFTPKGMCGDCANNDLCFGCRASALYYTGDIEAADPKCWLNPEAVEYYRKR